MKRVLLLRHAEAAAGSDDHARPLTARGELEASRAGRILRDRGWTPDRAVVSDARRTRDTLARLGLPGSTARDILPALYDAPPAAILAALREASPGVACQIAVAHNPGIGLAARTLASRGDPASLARLASAFPTAALAVVRLPVEDWSALAEGAGELEAVIWPEDVPDVF